VQLSSWGKQMSSMSGIRSIMEDIAAAGVDPSGGEWLNLSPGNPSLIPEVVSAWRALAEEALRAEFVESSCRYGPSRGSDALVAAIVEYFRSGYGWPIGGRNVVVGAGSQLLSFMAATSFTSFGRDGSRPLVLPRLPDYAGYQGLVGSREGIVGVEPVVRLEGDRFFSYAVDIEAIRRQGEAGMLLLSNPANPTGSSVTATELDAVLKVVEERDVPLVVDHAYGEPFPSVAETLVGPVWHPNVVNCFTFSKAGLPGERIAFAIGPEEVITPLVGFTANVALHAPQLIQAVAKRALESREIDVMTAKYIKPFYRNKRRMVEDKLFELMPESISWRLHSGDGGMFCWLWIDEPWFDDLLMYELLKRNKVLVVPGRHFFIAPMTTPFLSGHGSRCIRLSVSGDDSVVAEGIRRLGAALLELRRESRSG
jgi:valine--pyruvate aminotransferase